MHSVDEAFAKLIAAARSQARHEKIALPLLQCLNRVLACDVISPLDVPPRANSAMDGYAFCYGDGQRAGFHFAISQRIPAGCAPEPLQPATAARIFTGAEIPPGADTVAMQEDCQLSEGGVQIDASQVKQGDNIRPQGQDVQCGQRVLAKGTRLRPQELGLLASIGSANASIFRPLNVAVFSTGNELVEPGNALQPGQIYNSNRATLAGLLAAWGMDMVDVGICRDSPDAVTETLRAAAEQADVIVSSGGVSVGDEDHVKGAVETLGSLGFWKIALKPGKPLAFGEVQGVPFMGLPGNPASVFVTALLFLRPFLLALQGQENILPQATKLPSLFARKAVKRQEFLRARRADGGVDIHANQSSGMLSSACWGDGLAVQYPGKAIEVGDLLEFYPYSELS